MSGGSYNYLFQKSADEILNNTQDLQSMVDRLDELAYARDAAREAKTMLLVLQQFEARFSLYMERLSPIFRAVEWWDSGDAAEDGFKLALALYRTPELALAWDHEASKQKPGGAFYYVYKKGTDPITLTEHLTQEEAIAFIEAYIPS